MTAAEEKTPQYVHCKECKHEKVAFYAPAPIEEVVRFARASLNCEKCGAENSSMMGRYVAPDAEYKDYSDWALRGEVGISSATLLFAITGFDSNYNDHCDTPSDPSDFRRCYLLLKAFPELRPQIHMVAEKYPAWKALVEHWEELEKLLASEVGDIAKWEKGAASKTYARMKELLRGEA